MMKDAREVITPQSWGPAGRVVRAGVQATKVPAHSGGAGPSRARTQSPLTVVVMAAGPVSRWGGRVWDGKQGSFKPVTRFWAICGVNTPVRGSNGCASWGPKSRVSQSGEGGSPCLFLSAQGALAVQE